MFGSESREFWENVVTELLDEVRELTGIISAEESEHPAAQEVLQVLVSTVNNQTFIVMNPLQAVIGFIYQIIAALVDAKTLVPVVGATAVVKSETTDNAAIAGVDANGNLVPVAAGTCNLTTVNTWTYLDSITGLSVTADFTTISQVTVTAGVAGQLVAQVVTLGPGVAATGAAQAVARPNAARAGGPAR